VRGAIAQGEGSDRSSGNCIEFDEGAIARRVYEGGCIGFGEGAIARRAYEGSCIGFGEGAIAEGGRGDRLSGLRGRLYWFR